MKKILLPIDGSMTCFGSYDMAKKLAVQFDAEIIILHVQEPIQPFVWINEAYVAEKIDVHIEEHSKKLLENAKAYFLDDKLNEPIKITVKTEVGDPAQTIIDIADEEGCDMIIMCTHGMSAVKRFLMGSVTNKVVHHAKQSVLIVR